MHAAAKPAHETAPTRLAVVLLASFAAVFVWSAIAPYDRTTWWMEVAPALLGLAVLIPTCRRFPFTPVNYVLMWLFALILIVGGHYTYARVPIGDWAKEAFHFSRNHFDRVGHFMQGVIPAMVAREILVRQRVVRGRGWLFYICVSIALSISAAYELVEWIAAELSQTGAADFVGMQGDVWDAQKDMTMATLGAIFSQLLLGRTHTNQMRRLSGAGIE